MSNDKIESPWQPRVNVELERASLASKCPSFSSLISPWAVDRHEAKSPGSVAASSGASSNHEEDGDLVTSSLPPPESPFLREFQLAARQLEDLTLNMNDVMSDSGDSCPESLFSIGVVFVGWVQVAKSDLRHEPQKTLEASINSLQSGLLSDQEHDSRLIIYPSEIRIEVKQLARSIGKANVRVWGVINDKLGLIYKNGCDYECHVFAVDDTAQVTRFCQLLNEMQQQQAASLLKKCNSINSLVSDHQLEKSIDFQAECEYCGAQTIGTDYRADINQVHRIIGELENQDHQPAYCTISSASMAILPRPGSLFSVSSGTTLNESHFMKCRLRYISFFAVGIDSRYLAIVSVLGPESVCHVLKIMPNAVRVSDVLQEQIILRYQKAVEARKIFDRGNIEDKPMMSSIINHMLPEEPPSPNQLGAHSRWKSFLSLLKK